MNEQKSVPPKSRFAARVRGRFARTACFALAAIATSAPALLRAQGGTPPAEAPADFRGKVTLAYGIVFGVVVIYLVLSMRRNAGLAEEVAFLEKRLEELGKK